jgi:hypothetical protein
MRHNRSEIQRVFVLAVLLWASSAPALAQRQAPPPSRPGAVPADLQTQLRAAGPRLTRNGQERVVLQGEILDETGVARPAAITIEPGLVRLEGMRSDGSPILFDGRQLQAGRTERDQAILDVFALDSIEGMLEWVRSGASVRLLGRGFRPDVTPPPGDPPGYDIFEVGGPVPTRSGQVQESRRYYFDSSTGLLHSTRRTKSGVRLATRFSNWAAVDGSMYPGLIEHFQGGVRVLAFTTQTAATSPAEASVSTGPR